MATAKTVAAPSLEARIDQLHQEIDAMIARHVDGAKVAGVPRGVIEQMFWARVRGGHCRCAAFERLRELEAS
jgi:hypothetical protein